MYALILHLRVLRGGDHELLERGDGAARPEELRRDADERDEDGRPGRGRTGVGRQQRPREGAARALSKQINIKCGDAR